MTFGERLKLARESAGLSLRRLADKVPVSAQAISKYERNLCLPASNVLIDLCDALGVKPDFFFRTDRIELKFGPYRRQSRLGKRGERMVIARAQEAVERYCAAEALFPSETLTFEVPPGIVCRVERVEDAEAVAQQLRSSWGLGMDPITSLTDVLEEHGLKVVAIDGADGFDACVLSIDNRSPVIVVDRETPGDRLRFSMAHELGHLVLQVAPDLDEEAACNRFAAAFLVPGPRALLELGPRRKRLDFEELRLLKQKYGYSIQAWVRRARDLGIISQGAYINHFKQISTLGWKKDEPDHICPEVPKRMRLLILRALAENLVSRSRAAELLAASHSGDLELPR